MIEALVLAGGITTHPFQSNSLTDKYKNRIRNSGVITNSYGAVLVGNRKFKSGLLYGTDSLGGKIVGSISQINLHPNFDLVFGGYNYNRRLYEGKGVIAPNIAGITPVVGFNLKFILYEDKSYSIESHNLISIITTHSIGINFKI